LAREAGQPSVKVREDWYYTLATFALLTLTYWVKAYICWQDICIEFNDPTDLHLFPTFSISLLLLATVLSHIVPTAATALFLTGATLHLLLTLAIIHLWLNRAHFDVVHVNPIWLIPAVGNMLAAIAGVSLGFSELSWFFFSIGIVSWIMLLPIVIARLLFGPELSERFAPTLFILLAPPAVSFITYVMRKTQVGIFLKLAVGLETLLAFLMIILTVLTVRHAARVLAGRGAKSE
jgi:tellurite resistance protein